ncbi:PD-(D/E)XK nuclease family protein [Wolbachia endosymbiont of Drosophila tsacasi]|uniref:PD-(D/E)XK nuclease family protein n=1 Tax=Wolbachia endosymbiont of Drosophila tsacasi TaxID=3002579 RepID=UPI0023A9F6B8|nr:PD-(D/E)XK nuclease family protein [Wolbachia endosymbiont of Drosophila tsacasi]MDE5061779.1 PD-(D/E)XK nuclease family protein [Wolbachia endosymbiont of Drosophila tsacasi]
MGRVFTVNVDESLFDVLVQHIFSEYEREKIPEIKIILPCKRDVIALLSAFKNYNAKKCIILPEIVSLENIDEEDLILNLDRVKVINPTKRMLLLIQFILEWNRKNNDNFPIDLAYSLPSLLQSTQTTDCYQFDEHSKKIENFISLLIESWNKILKDLGVVDILEHKSDYINNMIISLEKDQHIIFVGIGKDKSLIKAIYDLPFGKIILPNLNLKIKEKDWQSLDKKHYQYCLKDLLGYLSIGREDVSFLPKACSPVPRHCDPENLTLNERTRWLYNRNWIPVSSTGMTPSTTQITCKLQCSYTKNQRAGMKGSPELDYVFDTTADLSKVSNGHIGNIEVITCDSREEEAQVTSLIIENEGYENVSLVVFDKLLAARIACLSRQHSAIPENYPYITLLLYSIEVLTSNWSSVSLLSLLKHRLVTFGYTQEEYSRILSEFEIEILRSFSINGLDDIIKAINTHKKLKHEEDILLIISKLDVVFNLLLDSINYPISDVVATHLQCINMLSGINFSELNNEIGNFTCNFSNACEGVEIKCSLELYSQILTLFLEKEFFSVANDLNKFSLYHNKVVILAGFNEAPSFQGPLLNALTREKFNLPSAQEEQGYFFYTLHNLFCASKVYITRSLSHRKPILLQRLEILLKEGKQPYRDWLRVLNTPECTVPCTQPMPKPQTEVRKEKMQVMSCSAIEKLIRNPYSFYVEYILGLKQLRDLNFKPSILEFGTMVHNILARYLRNEKSLMSIAREMFSTSQFNFSNMWWIRLQRVIQSFVELDETRSNYVELEKSFTYPIFPVSVHNAENIGVTEEILLTARCDRVEYLPSGQVAIIDYKLGTPPSNEEVMSGFFPQLILQALAVEHITKREVSELAYWKLDYDKIKVVSIQNYRYKMQELKNDLPGFLSNYLSNSTPFIASPYFLRFNSYKQLERVGEWL